jgi:hypothetical protein
MVGFSIIPCLALRGVGSFIARSKSLKAKVLLREFVGSFNLALLANEYLIVNGKNDRETNGYTASDYILYDCGLQIMAVANN